MLPFDPVAAISTIGNLFKTSDAEYYSEAMKYGADRHLDEVRDTNQTSTTNLKLQLNQSDRSERRWMSYLEDCNESSERQFGSMMDYFGLTSGSVLGAAYALRD